MDGSSPSWSPDGERILFSSAGALDTEIRVLNTDGTGEPLPNTRGVPLSGLVVQVGDPSAPITFSTGESDKNWKRKAQPLGWGLSLVEVLILRERLFWHHIELVRVRACTAVLALVEGGDLFYIGGVQLEVEEFEVLPHA